MTAFPLVIEGSTISALVVGGGTVATRKVRALLESGARVRLIAPDVTPELEALASSSGSLEIVRVDYGPEYLRNAMLVIAATDNAETNAQVAADARATTCLVNVADAPGLGNCITPAVHRSGDVVVAVSTGGVPNAAARIRDALGRRFDVRYASAVGQLASLRRSLLDAGMRDRWSEAATALLGDDFCEQVESGAFDARISEWA